ncbi:MAG: GTPase ObgE, partial [Bacteroidota bacterium]
LNEVQKFNPELMHKPRLLALSKSDMVDEELKEEISASLEELPHVYFSSITQTGLDNLKDEIWKKLNH